MRNPKSKISRENKAQLILGTILFIVFIVMITLNYWPVDNKVKLKGVTLDYLLGNSIDKKNDEIVNYYFQKFDPNLVTKETLLKMGVPLEIANNLLKYRRKGGIIKEKLHFRKIYGVTDSFYLKIAPYIEISLSPTVLPRKKICVNQATWRDFSKLENVDTKTAQRIVNYRDKLGGFVSIYQLKKVYGFNSDDFEKNHFNLHIEKPIDKKSLNAQTINFKKLKIMVGFKKAKTIQIHLIDQKSIKNWNLIKGLEQTDIDLLSKYYKL